MTTSDEKTNVLNCEPSPPRHGEDLYEMALVLSRSGVRGGDATEALLEAAADARAVRRAHRLAEYAVMRGWPAPHEVVKAFFYLTAARARI